MLILYSTVSRLGACSERYKHYQSPRLFPDAIHHNFTRKRRGGGAVEESTGTNPSILSPIGGEFVPRNCATQSLPNPIETRKTSGEPLHSFLPNYYCFTSGFHVLQPSDRRARGAPAPPADSGHSASSSWRRTSCHPTMYTASVL